MTLGLQKLAGEDPSLRLKTDQETGQTILSEWASCIWKSSSTA